MSTAKHTPATAAYLAHLRALVAYRIVTRHRFGYSHKAAREAVASLRRELARAGSAA